jgi:methylated-DNA-protein-cysteine methyltransferase-like protein
MKKKRKKKVAAKPRRKPVHVPLPQADQIYAAIRRIPRGKVCTYGGVAELARMPRRARLVGTVLRRTPRSVKVPWYRVINASGRISFPKGSEAYERQRTHLEKEGVTLIRGRVDLARYAWPSRNDQLDELLWKME